MSFAFFSFERGANQMLIGSSASAVMAAYQNGAASTKANVGSGSPELGQSAPSSTKVSISDAARQAAQADKVAAAPTSQKVLSDAEANQIPQWLAHYSIEIKQLELGRPVVFSVEPGTFPPEYSTRVQEIMNSVLKDNGVTSETYREAMITNKESSERLHQQFLARMKEDPQIVRWLNQAGVDLV